MIVRVLITRKIPELTGRDAILLPQLAEAMVELRNLANQQPGYVSGETLRNVDDPREYMVISTWKSQDHWDRWLKNEKRMSLQQKIDALLGAPTEYKVFTY